MSTHKRTAWKRQDRAVSINDLRKMVATASTAKERAKAKRELLSQREDKAEMARGYREYRKNWLFQRGHHARATEFTISLGLLQRIGTVTPKTELTLDQIKDKKLYKLIVPVVEKTGDQKEAVLKLVAYLLEHTDPGMTLSVLRSFIGLERLIMEEMDELPEMDNVLGIINWIISMSGDFDTFDRDMRLETEPAIRKLLMYPRYG
jgi:hypothetical protein